MHLYAARTILFGLFAAGCCWTVHVHCRGLGDPATTSWRIRRIVETCPQLIGLLALVGYALLCDALPEVNRWVVLGCVLLPMYALGHVLWPM